jgi:hypothetical protein
LEGESRRLAVATGGKKVIFLFSLIFGDQHSTGLITDMGSVKKKRRRKIAQHKRKKNLKAMRHKTK